MTTRDRIFLSVVSVLAVLAAVFLLAVAPEREKASKLAAQVAAAQAQLQLAEGKVANARGAQAQYASAYASIVSLGKAVPPSAEVPSLIFQLEHVSNSKRVDFFSITAGSGGTGGPAAAAAAAGSPAAGAGLTQMPFTFIFNGSYADLYHLFNQLNGFVRTVSGGLRVSGRLLTIQAVKLAPVVGSETKGGKTSSTRLTGTVTASAYVLPATPTPTGEASPSSVPGAATPASSTGGGASSPTAPAIVPVTP